MNKKTNPIGSEQTEDAVVARMLERISEGIASLTLSVDSICLHMQAFAAAAGAENKSLLTSPEKRQRRKTVRELLPEYQRHLEKTVKPSTVFTVVELLGRSKVAQDFLDIFVDELDFGRFQSLIDASCGSPSAIKGYVVSLRTMLKWVRKMDLCDCAEELKAKLDFPRVERKKGTELENDVIDKIEEAIRGEKYWDNIGVRAAWIALRTGMRIGEIAALTVGDFDAEKRILSITKTLQRVYDPSATAGKGATKLNIGSPKSRTSTRNIPVSEEVAAFLGRMAEGKKADDKMISAKNDIIIEPRSIRAYLESWGKNNGVGRFRFHNLRHTFISRKVRDGTNPKAVCAYVGHSDLKMTIGVYTHINSKDMEMVANEK